MPGNEPAPQFTPGEWLYCVWTLIRAGLLVLASGWDTAVMRRETDRMQAAMAAPSMRAERR
jgi:hypothetical protein